MSVVRRLYGILYGVLYHHSGLARAHWRDVLNSGLEENTTTCRCDASQQHSKTIPGVWGWEGGGVREYTWSFHTSGINEMFKPLGG